jgi:O-antigen ligase
VTLRLFYFIFRALMNREALDKFCERGILGLVLAILVFGPLATGAVRTQDFLVIQFLTIGVMLIWIARIWINRRPKFLWPPVCWAVLAFTIYAVARYLTADIEYVARGEMIRVLIYAFLFFAIVNNLHRHETMQLIAWTLIFLAMLVGAYAILQFATHSDKVWNFVSPYGHRGSGTFISPNNCAGFLEMILPLGLAWVLVSRAGATLRIVISYAALVMLGGIAVTLSRGGWVSTGVALTAFFAVLLLNRNYRLPSAVVLAAFVIAGFVLIPRAHFFKTRMSDVNKNEQINSDARFDLWHAAIEMWRTNPWWGVGPAHYDYRFREWRPVTEQLQPLRAHNDYLNTLADWGIAGVALVASALTLLGAGVVKTWKAVARTPSDLGARGSNKFALLLGATMGLIAILVHSLVDFNMHVPANAILAVMLMALLTSCFRFASDKHWFAARIPAKIFATIFLVAGMSYLGRQGILRAQEFHFLTQAKLAENDPDAHLAALQRAFAVEPKNPATAYDIGEAFRLKSWDGGEDYAELATNAMTWYERGEKLNPYDGYNFLRTGMCLDWIGQHEKAAPQFDRAVELDPNGYFTTANVGWHYAQIKDYAAAKVWFERSLHLWWDHNEIAENYLKICDQKLLEGAAQNKSAP